MYQSCFQPQETLPCSCFQQEGDFSRLQNFKRIKPVFHYVADMHSLSWKLGRENQGSFPFPSLAVICRRAEDLCIHLAYHQDKKIFPVLSLKSSKSSICADWRTVKFRLVFAQRHKLADCWISLKYLNLGQVLMETENRLLEIVLLIDFYEFLLIIFKRTSCDVSFWCLGLFQDFEGVCIV